MILSDIAIVNTGNTVDRSQLSTVPSPNLYFSKENIVKNLISFPLNSLYIEDKKIRKIRKENELMYLEYGDYLIWKNKGKYEILKFIQDIDNKFFFPNNDFILLRTENSYLIHFLNTDYGNKYIAEELYEIVKKTANPKTIAKKFEKIDIPVNFDDINGRFSDIERINESEVSPFDVKDEDITKIKIIQQPMSLFQIIRRMEHEEILLDGYFQRKANLWDNGVKSRLIETMIANIPIPAFYFDGTNDNKWQIVDGLQRLSAVKQFVMEKSEVKRLHLKELYYLKGLQGMCFDDLPRPEQRRIEEYVITAYIIQPGTPWHIKYKIFRSINTSALTLSPQEIRHAICQGDPANIIQRLTELPNFRKYILLNDRDIDRMGDRELALRYLAFRMNHYSDYKPSIVDFLDNAMNQIYTYPKNKLEIYITDLDSVLHVIYAIFKEDMFSLRMFEPQKPKISKRISPYLFDTWTYAIADLTEEERQQIIEKKAEVLNATLALSANERFQDAINDYYASNRSVTIQFEAIENLVKSILK